MSPPVPRINTFVQNRSKPIVEPISKVFIIASIILGVNRLPLLGTTNTYYIVFMLIYTTILSILSLYLTILQMTNELIWASLFLIDCLQYLNCIVLGFLLHKRLQNFYINLNKFDQELCINLTKFGIRDSIYNFLQLLATLILSTVLYVMNENTVNNVQYLLKTMNIKVLHCFELHYYGHLFSLMIPRLEALNDCLKSSYPNNKQRNTLTNSPDNKSQKGRTIQLDMKKIMDLYNNTIVAYDCLNDSVKWQMLSFLISIFYITLFLLYYVVKNILRENSKNHIPLLVSISLIVIQMVPVLVPCVFADRVQKEVRLMKDFLACKLYETTLDKPSRSTARALLALIETRDLSFSLFHMFDIDISLPFKFMALLLTYLIILLQFDKVISPDKSP